MFTWNELVAMGLINTFKDPELVIYFMSILKPMRRDYIEEEAREWHQSLRITQEERWKRIADLSKRRKFHQMNASVPITCKLPFDGGMWRNSCLLLKSIHYFREGFLKCRREFSENLEDYKKEMSYCQKIHTVNLILGDTTISQNFRYQWSREDIREALEDFILFEETDNAYDPELQVRLEEEKPFVIVEKLRINGDLKPIMDIIG
jgi:hypothetical protein